MRTPQFRVKANADGSKRYYWEPSASTRALGFKPLRLSDDKGRAILEAKERNLEVDEYRHKLARGLFEGAKAGTVRALIGLYKSHDDYLLLAERTRRDYGYNLELIARKLGVDKEYQQAILLAAPMHDVGKLGIPDSILLKPGRLTAEEFEIMKGHPKHGFDILNESSSPVIQLAASIALSHHERFDGAGYPRALRGEAIPLEGRIVAVADVFDALTSSRPYKKAWSLEDARAHLESGSGSHFDPACIDAFLGVWPQVLAIRDRFGED